jgi:hypothetical protein
VAKTVDAASEIKAIIQIRLTIQTLQWMGIPVPLHHFCTARPLFMPVSDKIYNEVVPKHRAERDERPENRAYRSMPDASAL